MTDGRKKKDSIDIDLNPRFEILLISGSLPLDQIGDELRNFRTWEKGF
jgi:hypothetical protein